jgi:hypothetical protein
MPPSLPRVKQKTNNYQVLVMEKIKPKPPSSLQVNYSPFESIK